VFTVDVNVPDGSETWSRCYDTPAIAEAADYVVLMAYDQTAQSSKSSGPVAGLDWVESNVVKLVERDGVPAGKLILGMPLYVRVWEVKKGSSPGANDVAGSRAVYMGTAAGYVSQYGASAEWDEASGQYYCEYSADGKSYRMWLEDVVSLDQKSSLAHKYNLAGVSCWSREFASESLWPLLYRNTKSLRTYQEWQHADPPVGRVIG